MGGGVPLFLSDGCAQLSPRLTSLWEHTTTLQFPMGKSVIAAYHASQIVKILMARFRGQMLFVSLISDSPPNISNFSSKRMKGIDNHLK
ncbi:hypothetical protein PHJA_002046100 [Phtheirospermum japonicum]|uniref:Uncharacterized protein n=1 Tax=Phtheirospermum japonicum TaxID=374723 RepID=A0A830CL93_9LAMI|nr:hypothetical protein PHJA_002046100 [Phtheirospermum japonicum]